MKDVLIGQSRAELVITRLMEERISGRTIILLGGRGCGKFTAAVEISKNILGKDPFFSTDFMFYRNDSFSVKTGFFLDKINEGRIREIFPAYLGYLSGRLSSAIALGEVGNIKLKKSAGTYTLSEFRNDLYNIANSREIKNFEETDPELRENLLTVSAELSKKNTIPIDFIRSAIEFNSLKSSSGCKVTVIGNFEKATEEAQNASLKLLEEPPDGNLIILTSDSGYGILPTIMSRSLVIHFNRLTTESLNKIFGFVTEANYSSTFELMEDELFHYREKRKERVLEFFTQIAPGIQQENSVFSFIENVISAENGMQTLHFFRELCEFLRNTLLFRQEFIRKTDLSKFTDPDYRKLVKPIIQSVNTAELSEASVRIGFLSNRVRYGNITPSVILPGLLIDLARWYQRALMKSRAIHPSPDAHPVIAEV
jgi:DNA polymerase III delta prime subunit